MEKNIIHNFKTINRENKIGVYKITSPSSKIYIGQSTDIEQRWIDYKKMIRCQRQTILYNSLKKYGPENHKFEIIEECSEVNLLERETYWKLFYKVLEIPSLCCRLDGKSGKCSEETKRKMSINRTGLKQSESTKIKISNTRKSIVNLTPYFLKPILQIDLNDKIIREWPSARDAGNELKINSINIRASARGKQKTAYGYKWKYLIPKTIK